MGNEQSKGKEHTKKGKLSVKHRNGSVNGVSATITGLEADFNGETKVQKNGGPLSYDLAIESLETDYVVIESVCPPAEAPVVSPEVPVISADVPVISAEVPVISAEVPVISPEAPVISPEVPVISAEVPVISAEVPVISAEVPVTSEIIETQKEEVKKSKEEKGKLFGKLFKKKAEPPVVVESVQEKESAEEKKESVEEKKEITEEKKENVEEKEASNEDQTDLSVPAPDPQPESGSSGDESAAVIITEDREDSEYLHQKAETSTQMDKTTEADISTQTRDADDDTAANTEDPAEEDSLNESVAVIAEEAVEETANEELSDNQTAGIITEKVIARENSAYENMVFRAEPMEVTDNFEVAHIKSNPAEETVKETEAEIAAEPESHSNKFIVEAGIIAEESNVEEMVPLEISSSLPKVVADCVQAVFAADCESTDFAAVNTTDPSADEAITEDNGEGTRDMSAAAVLIETAEPESNAVAPETREANDVPSLDEEPASTVTETISEVVCEETNPTPANQDVPVDELSVPAMTEILVKVESAKKEVNIDDVVAVEDAPGTSEEIIIVEAPSKEPNTTEEILKDALNSPVDEVEPKSVPKTIITGEMNAEVGEDVTADVAPETVEEADPSPVIVKDVVEVIPEAAIHALSLELSAIPPQEPAVDNVIPVEEKVIAPTTFVPLSGERETGLTIPEEPSSETVADEIEEAIDALSNELDAVQQSVEKVTTVKGVSEDVLGHAVNSETPEQVPAISEQPVEESPSAEDATAEVLGDILEAAVEAISEKLEAIESIVEEPADAPLMDATGESTPCISVQEELKVETVTPSEVLLEDADKEAAAPSVVADKEPTDSNLVISDDRVEESASLPENPSPCEEHAATEVLENIVESVVEAITGKLTENVVQEPADVPPVDATGEPHVSVQQELIEKNVPPAEVLLEGADKETANPSVVAVQEPTDSTLENIVEEPAAEQADVPPMDATGESEPCVSVQVNIAPSEDADKETAAPAVVVVEDQPTDSNPVISEEPVEDSASRLENLSPCEEHSTTEVLEDIVESVVEAIAEKLGFTETIVEEPADEQADVPPMDATVESEPCVSVQEEPVEENVVPAEVLLEDADKETAAPPVVVVEDQPTDSNPVISEEPVEDSASRLENLSPCEEHSTTEVLENIVESVVEAIAEKLAFTETIVEEPADEQADVPPMDATVESEPCVSVQEEPVEKNVVPAEVLLEDADKETVAPSVVAVEEPTDSNPVISLDPVEGSASFTEPKVLVVNIETTKDEVTKDIVNERDNSGDILAAIDGTSKDFLIATSGEPVAKRAEAVLETILEEIITKDVVDEWPLVTSEEVAPEIIVAGETEEKAENESSANSTDSIQSAETINATVTCTGMDALLVRLQSACASIVEESAYMLGDLQTSSLGDTVTVTIHVAPKEAQQ